MGSLPEDVTQDIIEEQVEKEIEKSPTPEVAETTEEKVQSEKDTVDKSGVLEIKVNEAKELENKAMLGKSDPYVFIQFENSKFQSQTVNSNLAPKWGFSAALNISEDNANSIQFSVFDDNYGKDQLLGSCSVSVGEALQLANKEEQWIPLEGCKSGTISVSFNFTEHEEESSDQVEEVTVVKTESTSNKAAAESQEADICDVEAHQDSEASDEKENSPMSGVLEVKVTEAKELENKAMLGKSDPYVIIKYDNNKFQSKTVNSSLAPKWDFTTNLNISEEDTNSLQFEVFDENYGKDPLLGSCSISIAEALERSGKSDDWIPLEGCKSGMIAVAFKFTEDEEETCDQVEENTDVKDDGKSGDETEQKDGKGSSDKEDEKESSPEPEKEKKEVVEEDMVNEKTDEVTAEKIDEKVACEGENADIDSPTSVTDNGLTKIEKTPSKTSLLAHQVKSFDSF